MRNQSWIRINSSMGILKVANIHFNQAATSRLEYLGSNTIQLIANTGGISFTQNTIEPRQANTVSFEMDTLHIGFGGEVNFGNNVRIVHSASGLSVSGAGAGYSFNNPVYMTDTNVHNPPSSLKPPSFQFFTSSGTWNKPTGCRKIKVTAIGGGGGGGGGQGTGSRAAYGAGGEGGALSIKWLDVSSWSNSTTVTIGAGGSGGAGTGGQGSSGGTTSFGTHMSCPGGAGGYGMTSDAGNDRTLTIPGKSYSTGTGGNINSPCSSGVPGWLNNSPNGSSGQGGKGLFGVMAPGSCNFTQNLRVNGKYGGGGSGAVGGDTNVQGGNGGAGAVLVEEYY